MRVWAWAVCIVLWACGTQSGGTQQSVFPPPPTTDPGDGGTPAADAGPGPDGGGPAAVNVDPWKELVIVDASVVLDGRAASAGDGAWSFRQMMERLGGAGITEAWLRTYRQASLNGFALPDRAGVEDLIASWPRAADGSLDLSRAPFRLLAIVSRLDLPGSPNGESRLIYGLYDPATGAAGKMTVAFEYRLPALGTGNDRSEWARRWHALGDLPYGEELNAALQRLTDAFAQPGSLSQVRANEQQFGEKWQLRQWVLEGGSLRLSTTPLTPDQTLNGTARLSQFILDNADAFRAGTATIPAALQGGASPELGAWVFKSEPRIDEALRNAFAQKTCNGCHAQETNSLQGFFHVSPFKPVRGDGRDRVSDFLREQEIPRRASRLQELLR